MAFWGRAQVPSHVTSGGGSGRVAVEDTDQPSDDAAQRHRHGVCIPWSWVTGLGLSSEEPRAVVSETERSLRDAAVASSDGPEGQVTLLPAAALSCSARREGAAFPHE